MPPDTGPAEGRRVVLRARAVARWISVGEQAVGATAILATFVLVFIGALQRYLPVSGWLWTGELSRFCLVWMTYGLVGYLFGQGQHITLQVVDAVAPPRVLRGVKAFASVVVAAISIGFAIGGWVLINTHGQLSPALQMPMEVLYVIPFLGFVLTAARGIWGVFDPAVIDPRSVDPQPSTGGDD